MASPCDGKRPLGVLGRLSQGQPCEEDMTLSCVPPPLAPWPPGLGNTEGDRHQHVTFWGQRQLHILPRPPRRTSQPVTYRLLLRVLSLLLLPAFLHLPRAFALRTLCLWRLSCSCSPPSPPLATQPKVSALIGDSHGRKDAENGKEPAGGWRCSALTLLWSSMTNLFFS